MKNLYKASGYIQQGIEILIEASNMEEAERICDEYTMRHRHIYDSGVEYEIMNLENIQLNMIELVESEHDEL